MLWAWHAVAGHSARCDDVIIVVVEDGDVTDVCVLHDVVHRLPQVRGERSRRVMVVNLGPECGRMEGW